MAGLFDCKPMNQIKERTARMSRKRDDFGLDDDGVSVDAAANVAFSHRSFAINDPAEIGHPPTQSEVIAPINLLTPRRLEPGSTYVGKVGNIEIRSAINT